MSLHCSQRMFTCLKHIYQNTSVYKHTLGTLNVFEDYKIKYKVMKTVANIIVHFKLDLKETKYIKILKRKTDKKILEEAVVGHLLLLHLELINILKGLQKAEQPLKAWNSWH